MLSCQHSDPVPVTHISREFAIPPERVPKGLEAVYAAFHCLYRNHTNPLQVTARRKCWLGGPDPLDFISIYPNHGNPQQRVPPHWHYVSMGLSDLYGDGRVYRPAEDLSSQPSGCGFEITFRLREGDDEEQNGDFPDKPPVWPAALMQQLARNIRCGGSFCVGDPITWHVPLDGQSTSSHMRHILLAEDPQLPRLHTPHGLVDFIQLVGVCQPEVKAAQRWNGRQILQLLRSNPLTGGELLITDLRRYASIFEIDPRSRDLVEAGIARDGSSLDGANVEWCCWSELSTADSSSTNHSVNVPASVIVDPASIGGAGHASCSNQAAGTTPCLSGVEIRLNLEAALTLPLMVNDRLAHGRPFSFTKPQGVMQTGRVTITFVPPEATRVQVTPQTPFVYQDWWLQVYVDHRLREAMRAAFRELELAESRVALPKVYLWPDYRLKIIIEAPCVR